MEDNKNDFAEYVKFHLQNNVRVPNRYIRDMQNPMEMYNDQEFRKRYRFNKLTVVNVLVPMFVNITSSSRGIPIFILLLAQVLYDMSYYTIENHFVFKQMTQ